MSSARILHVSESLGRGGAEQGLVNLLPQLRALGHTVEVAALWQPYPLADALEAKGVVVHRLDIDHRWNIAQALSRLAAVARRRRYDVMHAHGFFATLYVALTRPLLPRIRRFTTLYNLGYESFPANTAWRRVRKRIHAAILQKGVDVRLAVSTAVARHHQQHLGPLPIDVQHDGIPVDELTPSAISELERARLRSLWQIADGKKVIIIGGRLVHEKGHRFLLAALSELGARKKTPHLVIVGDGPLETAIADEIERRNLTAQVTMHRAIPHDQLVDWFRVADVVVMPSTHEGLPFAAREAMALGRPVVASSVGGLPEIIEDGVSGMLTPPADPPRLADAIERVLDDELLAEQLARNGRVRVVQYFSSRAVAAQLLDRYIQALRSTTDAESPAIHA